jgi:beta-lactamase regulating signal transducer with metallopeptidase domain
MTAFAWALVHFVWQGAAIGALAVIVQRLTTRPSARYVIGVGALAMMVVSVAGTFAILTSRAEPPDALSAFEASAPGAPDRSTPSIVDATTLPEPLASGEAPGREASPTVVRSSIWTGTLAALNRPPTARAIVLTWLAGVIVFTLRLTGAWIVTRRLATRAIRPIAAELKVRAQVIADRLALSQPVRLFESAAVRAPMIIGWIRPIVLMPAAVLTGLSMAQVEALIAHELAHLRRHDPVVNLLQSVVETLLFYHPAVWWVSRGVRQDREHCCDDLAISVTGDRLTYATALADLASQAVGPQVALAASGGSLVARIARALGEPQPRSWAPAAGSAVLLTVIAFAGLMPLFAAPTPALPYVGRTDLQSAGTLQAASSLQSANSGGLRNQPALRKAATPTQVQVAPAPSPDATPQPPQTTAPSPARISGRVVGSNGVPVPNVAIRLLEKRTVAGRARLLPTRWGRDRVYTGQGLTQADANGQFSFGGLAAGTYYLLAAPEPFGFTSYEWMGNGPQGPGPTGFSPAYYPSGIRTTDAAPIQLQGSDVTNLTITLAPAQAGTIVLQPMSASAPDQPATAQDRIYMMANLYLAPDGEPQLPIHRQLRRMGAPLVFANLPAGDYVSSTDPHRRISVRPGETTTVPIPDRASVTLRGRASFDGNVAPASAGPAAVRLEPTNPINATFPGVPPPSSAFRRDQNWGFEIRTGPSVGVLRVEGPPGWAVKSITLNGRDITDEPLTFDSDVQGIEILMTTRLGSVTGTIVDANLLAATRMIVLYPEDRALAAVPSRFTRVVRADDQGRFSAIDLLPGRYLALAFEGYESENADWIESARTRATPFTVTEGVRTTVTLPVVK